MLELTFTITVFAAWIASVCLHEFGHAIVAYWGGDTSVKEKGYLTLNPLKYTNVGLSIILPVFFLLIGGIPLPGAAVYVDHSRLRSRFWKSAVSAAGPVMTILFALVLAAVLQLGWPNLTSSFLSEPSPIDSFGNPTIPSDLWLGYAISFLLALEVAATVLNLLPIPPLDGYGILEPWLPIALQTRLRKFSRYGILLVLAALWLLPDVNLAFWNLVSGISNQLGVTRDSWGLSYFVFRNGAIVLLIPLVVVLIVVKQINKRRNPSVHTTKELEYQLETTDEMIEANPRSITAWYQRGLVLANLNRSEEAIPSFQKAVELKPKFWQAWHVMGIMQYRLQRYQEALNAVEQALQIQPKNPELQYLKGSILNSLTQYDAAIAVFDQILAKQPRNTDALMDKGSALYFSQRYPDAIAVLNQVIRLEPKNASAYFNQACCYTKLGDLQSGLATIRQAAQYGDHWLHEKIRTDPDLALLREHPDFPSLDPAE